MQEEAVLSNQTQFSLEEPYRFAAENTQQSKNDDPLSQKKRKPLFLVVGGVFALLLVVLGILVLVKPKTQKTIVSQPEASPVIVPEEQSPLLQRINRLSTELEDADPVKQSLLFPPVDLEIRLDPEQK